MAQEEISAMPQIGPALWKTGLEYYWYRIYRDGREEAEFDLDTGQIKLWGWDAGTLKNLKRVGWLPVSPDLAKKMQFHGEFGYPHNSPPVFVNLRPDEEPIIEKDCMIIDGYRTTCKICGFVFRTTTSLISICPQCGTRKGWKCDLCNEIVESKLDHAGHAGHEINPFQTQADKWDEVTFNIGIQGMFRIKFNSRTLNSFSESPTLPLKG